MKRSARLFAGILIVAMMVSLLCVPAFADEEENVLAKYSAGTGYVAFGDSFTRGYGASANENWADETHRMDDQKSSNCRNVTGAYPLLIATEIGCNTPDEITDKSATYWPIAQNAVTTAFILDLLGIDDGVCDAEYLYSTAADNLWEQDALASRYQTDLAYFGDPDSFAFGGTERYGMTGSARSVRELVNDASLITIQLGMGDVIQRAQLLGLKGVDMSDIGQLAVGAEKMIALMYAGFEYWKNAYPLLLDYIKENNEDCTVVIVSAANPISNIVISEDILVPVGSALSVITGLMRECYEQWAKEYGYIFVDVNNVEFPAETDEITFTEYLSATGTDQGLIGHPTPNGYSQIARMILDALYEKENAEQNARNTIKVELGRFKSVDYVLVDGKKVTNYELNDSVLSVKCCNPFAKTLTVSSHDGIKVAVSVYSLSYDNGFSANKLYTTNDVLGVVKTTITTVAKVAKTALGKLFGTK